MIILKNITILQMSQSWQLSDFDFIPTQEIVLLKSIKGVQ